ncbi:hypothetical protein SPRG_17995 [Saprolegnia parasitica CBS 223.65]|uniref:Uncharacterized protein n=1 Tax=Saprolegnia parasitica (strain CBS 223.65) TaxID=695850 RepID=A0A067BEC5_SAPPC|nr:hypothetical protein SPRG_17995 [Saprolegnia parasitica CBS 223.65]KDO16483.1 hypothetical protein SPRG_17995 [Saprolegnia parasitica CBS 223.65]|eukprot:XP_012212810.1 hypothetical protein SPRG_17995 [Saprolegnia parasitica CBS 223.65]
MVLSWLSLSLVAPYTENDCFWPDYNANNASHLLTHSFNMELAFASQTASGWTTGVFRTGAGISPAQAALRQARC